jgi:hypothetical protein
MIRKELTQDQEYLLVEVPNMGVVIDSYSNQGKKNGCYSAREINASRRATTNHSKL